MKTPRVPLSPRSGWLPTLFLFVSLLASCSGAQQSRDPGTAARWAGEPAFAAAMIGPLTKETPLQIVSLFSYEPGEALISPATELAQLVTAQRKSGDFGKEPLRTLLLEPKPDSIKAQRLLFIALGPRAEFSLARMREVGATAMHEALRLGVEHMAFAPVVRDQGVTAIGADQVAAAFVEGALVEWSTARRTDPQAPLRLKEVTYEAGPAFIEAVKKAVPSGVEAAHARIRAGAGGA